MLLNPRLFEVEYHPSILNGSDNEALGILIPLHAPTINPTILDCTFGLGTMWDGCNYSPDCKLDLRFLSGLSVTGDFMRLPFQNETWEVIVFDPPHLPTAAASPNSSRLWEMCYGITPDCQQRAADNVIAYFHPFLLEAKRLLSADGVILAKIADLVHNHLYQWQHIAFINTCLAVGLTACDMMIKRDPRAGNLKSSKWQNPKHLRKSHSYWIVARKGKCERRASL